MKKKFKSSLIIFLAAIMIFSLPLSASAATKRDVTKTYSKSVTKLLRGFDSYFGYCCGKNQYFKFDDYARTTMVTMKNYKLWEKNISYVKKKNPATTEALLQYLYRKNLRNLQNMAFLEILLICFVIRMVKLFIRVVTGAKLHQKDSLKRSSEPVQIDTK